MATQVQNRRGTTAEHSTFTGAVGELTVDTDKDTVVVHDGTTVGGRPLLRENGSQNLVTTGTITGASLTPSSSSVPTNGVYLPAANTVGVATNGTGRLFINSSGQVGIGNSNPTDALSITASGTTTLRVASSDTSGSAVSRFRAIFLNGAPGGNNNPIDLRAGDQYCYLLAEAAVPLLFGTNNTERVRLDASGRLLIGTSSGRDFFKLSGYQSRLLVEQNDLNISTYLQAAFVLNDDSNEGANVGLGKSRGITAGSNTVVQNGDTIGSLNFFGADGTGLVPAARISADVDGTPGTNDMPGRLVFSTCSDGASSPTERMRITNAGVILGGNTSVNGSHPKAHLFRSTETTDGAGAFIIENSNGTNGTSIFVGVGAAAVGYNASNCVLGVYRCNSNSRSINAAGSINASGADYAEYMTKAGNFTIAKGDVCGINAEGKLTNIFADSLGFLVKSTDPSYVGSDTWGLGFEDDPEALEAARQEVDRVAFAGQVPVNVIGATPGQYIVPSATEDGGITGIAKDETDLTLTEYMRAVGKVIAIEADGRARIIVKVA